MWFMLEFIPRPIRMTSLPVEKFSSGPIKSKGKIKRVFHYVIILNISYHQSNPGLECNVHEPINSSETHYTTNTKKSGLKCSSIGKLAFLPPIPIIRMKF